MGTILNWGNPLYKSFPLFLLGFGVITIYIPGVIGASISTGWLFLIIVTPILLLYCDLKLGLGFLFLCYATISLAWSKTLNIAYFQLLQIIALGCVFVIGQNVKSLEAIFKGLALGLGVSAIAAIAQKLGYFGVYTLNNQIAGLFINPNIYSEISAILLISLLVLKLWWLIPLTLPGLVLAPSRTAILALGVGLILWAWRRNKLHGVVALVVSLVIGLLIYQSKFNIGSISERFDLWIDTIKGFTLLGNGVGSYEILFPLYAEHINTELARPKYAHNDLLNLIYEFGIGSLLILMVLFNAFKSGREETAILATVFIVSLFTYPLHVPATAFIAFLVAGYVIGNHDTYRNSGIDRRPILFTRN